MRQSRAVLGVLTKLWKRFSLAVATDAGSGRENGGKFERLGWEQRCDGWGEKISFGRRMTRNSLDILSLGPRSHRCCPAPWYFGDFGTTFKQH